MDKVSEGTANISVLLLVGICIYWLLQLKFMLIITVFVMYVMGCAFSVAQDFASFKTTFFIFLIVGAVLLVFNRGLVTRIYDPADVLSVKEEFMLNQQIRYEGKMDGASATKAKLFIVTNHIDGKCEEKTKEILKKLNRKENIFIIVLNYDDEGNFVRTGYQYSLYWFYTVSGLDEMQARISKIMVEDGLNGNIDKISNCIAVTFGEIDYFDDYDDDFDAPSPGVHWVDDYYRSDGTHVDGHWRTNPDGDPTNNFSYNGK